MPRRAVSAGWGERAKKMARLYCRAEEFYREIRKDHPGVEETLQTLYGITEADMVEAFVTGGGPWQGMGPEETRGAYFRKMNQWCVQWELEWRRMQREIVAQDDADVQLIHLRSLERQMKDLLDKAIQEANEKPGTGTSSSYQIAYRQWTDVVERLNSHVASLQERELARASIRPFKKEKKAVFLSIYKEYKGKGQVYRMLCDRAASAYVGLTQLEAQGKGMGHPEHKALNADFISLIAQIQRHTESIKTEVYDQQLFDFGGRIMQIVERHLSGQPLILRRIISEIEAGQFDMPQLIEGSVVQEPLEEAS